MTEEQVRRIIREELEAHEASRAVVVRNAIEGIYRRAVTDAVVSNARVGRR